MLRAAALLTKCGKKVIEVSITDMIVRRRKEDDLKTVFYALEQVTDKCMSEWHINASV